MIKFVRVLQFIALGIAGILSAEAALSTSADNGNSGTSLEPQTPRELFNEGTKLLQQTNLWRAEYCLERALSSQAEPFQSPSLYNLGHVRFSQGSEELKKGPPHAATASRGQAAGQQASEALRSANDALADSSVEKLVASYLQGRGARRELRSALKAVKAALQVYGKTLNKWERSSGDFKSALELNASDSDARHNADVVDRCIARLVDRIQQLQQMAQAMGQQEKELGEKMKQMKGRIPAPDMPPGSAGDEDEEEDFPNGKEPGPKDEGPTKEGGEMPLSPEQASWLLEAFGSGRLLLPVEATKGGTPKAKDPW
jgi:tetratricopeptide (TPR) repeat protein